MVKSAYSALALKSITISAYVNRTLPWFGFVGLIEKVGSWIKRPVGIGEDMGLVVSSENKSRSRNSEFLVAASPEKVERLAVELWQNGSMDKKALLAEKKRNQAYDLVGLRLAYWRNDTLIATNNLSGLSSSSEVTRLVAKESMNSRIVMCCKEILQKDPDIKIVQLGKILAEKLGRTWGESSCKVNGRRAKSWYLNYVNSENDL